MLVLLADQAHPTEATEKGFALRLKAPQTLTYDQTWTPMKRLASVMEQVPKEKSLAEDEA